MVKLNINTKLSNTHFLQYEVIFKLKSKHLKSSYKSAVFTLFTLFKLIFIVNYILPAEE